MFFLPTLDMLWFAGCQHFRNIIVRAVYFGAWCSPLLRRSPVR